MGLAQGPQRYRRKEDALTICSGKVKNVFSLLKKFCVIRKIDYIGLTLPATEIIFLMSVQANKTQLSHT